MAETGFEYKTDFKDAKTRGGLGVCSFIYAGCMVGFYAYQLSLDNAVADDDKCCAAMVAGTNGYVGYPCG